MLWPFMRSLEPLCNIYTVSLAESFQSFLWDFQSGLVSTREPLCGLAVACGEGWQWSMYDLQHRSNLSPPRLVPDSHLHNFAAVLRNHLFLLAPHHGIELVPQ
ncbi:MAG: hypothetical protein HC767_05540 [Akkermansiaceae bacterium]|nr:hypothetical protein [Akkermansiaceae bacterium]